MFYTLFKKSLGEQKKISESLQTHRGNQGNKAEIKAGL